MQIQNSKDLVKQQSNMQICSL